MRFLDLSLGKSKSSRTISKDHFTNFSNQIEMCSVWKLKLRQANLCTQIFPCVSFNKVNLKWAEQAYFAFFLLFDKSIHFRMPNTLRTYMLKSSMPLLDVLKLFCEVLCTTCTMSMRSYIIFWKESILYLVDNKSPRSFLFKLWNIWLWLSLLKRCTHNIIEYYLSIEIRFQALFTSTQSLMETNTNVEHMNSFTLLNEMKFNQ